MWCITFVCYQSVFLQSLSNCDYGAMATVLINLKLQEAWQISLTLNIKKNYDTACFLLLVNALNLCLKDRWKFLQNLCNIAQTYRCGLKFQSAITVFFHMGGVGPSCELNTTQHIMIFYTYNHLLACWTWKQVTCYCTCTLTWCLLTHPAVLEKQSFEVVVLSTPFPVFWISTHSCRKYLVLYLINAPMCSPASLQLSLSAIMCCQVVYCGFFDFHWQQLPATFFYQVSS